ncbi:MAG: hypothetical protein WCA20_07890 [Candidatus Sulfotelmatobacter sp.]
MCKIRIFLYLHSLCAALMLAALPLDAQQDQAALSFQATNGQNTFHIGERIPLKLTFSSPNDTDYLIAPLVRGRGDEFDCNRFEVVSPAAGWSDPLAMYFNQDLLQTGHGWSWPPLQKSKPVEASLDLNEWIRFDQPGDYTIRITSFCVSKVQGPVRYSLSKTIKLQIVPSTPEWQNEKFKSIQSNLDLLDQPAPQAQPGESSQSQWERRGELFESARADLKYLATSAAIDEMTYRLRDEKYNFADQCSMGLMGLPPTMRETAIASMNERIEEPDFPIARWFFSTLSFLHVTPGSEKEGIRKQREAINPVIWSAIFSAVTKKEPVARAQTVQTSLGYGRNISTPEVTQQMVSLLKLSFLDLDRRSQTDDLRNEWDRLRSPEFLPTLQALARLPVRSASDLQVFVYDLQQLKGLALKRWYDLDPEGAHREIVRQIGSASPSLAAQSIAFLPEELFPQLEPIWAQALLDTTDQLRERALGSLLVRFGTGGVSKQMIAKLAEKRNYPCDAHIVALAYLARFNPNLARQKLKQEFPGECSDNLLRFSSELTTAPVLNDQAVENLNSTEPETVRDALRYLTSYGRKEDEPPLWRGYVKWTAAYKGKAYLLDRRGNDWDKTFDNSVIGEEMGHALIAGQGWFADPKLIARVLKRCVGESMCKRLKDDAGWAVAPYQLNLPDLTMPSVGMVADPIGVAQYGTSSLKLFEAKISQFPPGSKFVLGRWYRPSNSDERTLEAEVRTILERRGMSVGISQD